MSKAQSNRKAQLSEAQPKKLGIQCAFEVTADKNMVFAMFSKAQPSKVCYLQCFPRLGHAKAQYFLCIPKLNRATYGIYGVFGMHVASFGVPPADPSGEPTI